MPFYIRTSFVSQNLESASTLLRFLSSDCGTTPTTFHTICGKRKALKFSVISLSASIPIHCNVMDSLKCMAQQSGIFPQCISIHSSCRIECILKTLYILQYSSVFTPHPTLRSLRLCGYVNPRIIHIFIQKILYVLCALSRWLSALHKYLSKNRRYDKIWRKIFSRWNYLAHATIRIVELANRLVHTTTHHRPIIEIVNRIYYVHRFSSAAVSLVWLRQIGDKFSEWLEYFVNFVIPFSPFAVWCLPCI